MEVAFDLTKDRENIRKHGVSLSPAEDFHFDSAVVRLDDRKITERIATVLSGSSELPCSLSFSLRGETVRAINLRRATYGSVARTAPF